MTKPVLERAKYIDRNFIKKFGHELEPGEEKHFHHCKLGHNNDRMYIKKLEDGTGLLAHCFHCGKSGAVFNLDHAYVYRDPKDSEEDEIEHFDYTDILSNKSTSPSYEKCLKYLSHKCGINSHVAKLLLKDGQLFKFSDKALYVPVGDKDTIHGKGYKKKIFDDTWTGPKWLTKAVGPNDFIFRGHEHKDVLVIVEDSFSAYRIATDAQASALWIGGTKLQPSQIKAIGEWSPRLIVVFLDNDNLQVINQATAMSMNLLDLGFPTKRISHTDSDPKSYTKKELVGILDECI